MKPLNDPRLVHRLELLVEMMGDEEITGKAADRIHSLWVFWQTLWEVHFRLVVQPHYAWRFHRSSPPAAPSAA